METSMDTLTRADEERSKLGIHELDISFGGELDLHRNFNSCHKNPGHSHFIPVCSLCQHDLPEVLRSLKTLTWIKYMAQLTVKLSVNYVSPNRLPKPYPLSECTGQRILSVGSGFVTHICPTDDEDTMTCPFEDCHKQPGQHQVYGYITIATAAHVVFDDAEAKNTTVDFFYDSSDDRSAVLTARGIKVGAVSVEGDFCELLCVSHDRDLFLQIKRLLSCPGQPSVLSKCKQYSGTFFSELLTLPCLKNVTVSVHSQNKLTLYLVFDVTNDLDTVRTLHTILTHIDPVQEILKYVQEQKQSKITVLSQTTQLHCVRVYNDHHEQSRSRYHSFHLSPQDTLYPGTAMLDEMLEWWKIMLKPSAEIQVTYNTSDATVLVSLHSLIESGRLQKILMKMFPLLDNVDDNITSEQAEKWLIHISHPHGQSKHVTIGRQVNCLTGDGFYQHVYTVPTCSGSSGGPVWFIPESEELNQVYGVPHSGCHGNQVGEGCSWTLHPCSNECYDDKSVHRNGVLNDGSDCTSAYGSQESSHARSMYKKHVLDEESDCTSEFDSCESIYAGSYDLSYDIAKDPYHTQCENGVMSKVLNRSRTRLHTGSPHNSYEKYLVSADESKAQSHGGSQDNLLGFSYFPTDKSQKMTSKTKIQNKNHTQSLRAAWVAEWLHTRLTDPVVPVSVPAVGSVSSIQQKAPEVNPTSKKGYQRNLEK